MVGDIIHDVNKIQDFAPYVAKIKEAAPDTVITGNWSSDLLLLMKAAGDAGLKVRFASYWLDQPGNIANAGATALGHYNVSSFNAEANGEATAAFAEDFKAKTGQYRCSSRVTRCTASGSRRGAQDAQARAGRHAQR